MNALGGSMLAVIVLVVLIAPRRWAVLAVMAGVIYVTEAQQLQIFGFNFFSMRFVELAAFIRVMLRREFTFRHLNGIDKALLLFLGYATVVFVLRSHQDIANQIGVALDALLCYFSFRGLIKSFEEFRAFLKSFAILLIPFVILVVKEALTGANPFAILGAAPTSFREGRIRAIGSFGHPSLLGTLGGSFLPLYIGLAFSKSDRIRAILGIGLCLAIVWASNSGGPAACVMVGIAGWACWFFRRKMRLIRRAIAVLLILLALVMKAPIWYLPARVSSVTGGDGWHRSYLMDVTFQHFREWWFAGMAVEKTKDWFPYFVAIYGGADITNEYLAYALASGLVAMVLFILLLTLAFKKLGAALSAVRQQGADSGRSEPMLWALGVMLAVHVSNWIGITYFDQTYVIWYLHLALISTLSAAVIDSASDTSPFQDRTESRPEIIT